MSEPHTCVFGDGACWCNGGRSNVNEATGRRERGGCAQDPGCWPMASEGLGVHPGQRREAYDESVRLGVPTDYDQGGRAVLTDPGHRNRLMKALGYQDRGTRVITQPVGRRSRERV